METKRTTMKDYNKFIGPTVYVREGEDINRALRKFKNKVEDSGKLKELQKKEFYEKPTTERKRKKASAKARWNKKLKDQQLPKKMY
jgi:small subunit ribosomal protein S21